MIVLILVLLLLNYFSISIKKVTDELKNLLSKDFINNFNFSICFWCFPSIKINYLYFIFLLILIKNIIKKKTINKYFTNI